MKNDIMYYDCVEIVTIYEERDYVL